MNNPFEAVYLTSAYSATTQCMLAQVGSLMRSWCIPFTVLTTPRLDSQPKKNGNLAASESGLTRFSLDPSFDLGFLLSSSIWIDKDIRSLAIPLEHADYQGMDDSSLGRAFFEKYGHLQRTDDARSVVSDWSLDLKRALSHVGQKAASGSLLHIGSDASYEPPILHSIASSVILVDIAEKLLHRAVAATPSAEAVITKAEKLHGIASDSIDLVVALRVFCSTGFTPAAAVKQVVRALRPGGSVLLSVSNGYKAIDDTILPGQIVGSPTSLDFSLPFEEAITILSLLYDASFRELFLLPSNTEIFLGGTFLPYNGRSQRLDPILHIESIDHIPLRFYSSLMPMAWLGNYSPHPVQIDSVVWPTLEHFFHAEKFANPALRELVRNSSSPDAAKSLAWSLPSEVRRDWSTARVGVMRRGLRAKFDQHPHLQSALLSTKRRELIELSPSDRFWGRSACGEGQNMMGILLMALRAHYEEGGFNEA